MRYHCDKPRCPGHLSATGKCPDLDAFEPSIRENRISSLRLNFPKQEKWFQPTSIPQTRPTTTNTSSQTSSTVYSIIIPLALLLVAWALWFFGVERMLVAAEGLFLFGGWAALRAAELFRKQEVERLENIRIVIAMCFGLCCGLLAAYLILTTSEGQAITEWVTAQTLRIVGSLFVSVIGLGVLEVVWHALSQWVRGKVAAQDAASPRGGKQLGDAQEGGRLRPPNFGTLSGETQVYGFEDRVYEVFYERPFKRPPHLALKRHGPFLEVEVVEQRKDGFRIKGHCALGGSVKWEAEGEFSD